jgi:putative flippase GtrA
MLDFFCLFLFMFLLFLSIFYVSPFVKETAQIHVSATVSFFSNICFVFSHTYDQLNRERACSLLVIRALVALQVLSSAPCGS